MHVPILDLTRQYKTIKPEIDAAVANVLASGRFILGPEVKAFEEEVATYCNVKHAIGVASGTDALLLSLRALGVGPGDKVILPSFTFFATAGVVHNVGATPVFADIDPKTFNLDPAAVRRILTTNHELRTSIKAIIPVHLYGQMADMDEIMDIAKEYNIAVVEDAAQAIGATYSSNRSENHELRTTNHAPNGLRTTNHELGPLARKAGTIGDLGCFSFFPTKNLGAYGDGGMIVTNDDALAERVRILRVHGSKPKYYHRMVGVNSRLDALQAAILRVKLPHLDAWTAARQRVAARYDELLHDVEGIETPYHAPNRSQIFHQYTIRVLNGQRDKLRDFLKEQGIGTFIYYPLSLHVQECFQELGYCKGDLPQSELASQEVLSLPVFPELGEEEQTYVVRAIQDFFDTRRS
jgi:dTDP-4-amino-4,6-dideoxygalactose transaminase